MWVGLAVLVVVILASFYYAHRSRMTGFNAFDLVMENGRASKTGVICMGAFFITTWIMLHLTLNGRMTEGYLTIYGGLWVAPILARIFKGNEKPDEKAGPA